MSNSSTSHDYNSPELVMQIMDNLNAVIDKHEQLARSRMLPRREIVLPLRIMFLNVDRQPCSETIPGVSLDISFGGMGFLSSTYVEAAEFALVQFEEALGQHTPLVVDLKNKEMLGSFCKMGGLFEVNWEPESVE